MHKVVSCSNRVRLALSLCPGGKPLKGSAGELVRLSNGRTRGIPSKGTQAMKTQHRRSPAPEAQPPKPRARLAWPTLAELPLGASESYDIDELARLALIPTDDEALRGAAIRAFDLNEKYGRMVPGSP